MPLLFLRGSHVSLFNIYKRLFIIQLFFNHFDLFSELVFTQEYFEVQQLQYFMLDTA